MFYKDIRPTLDTGDVVLFSGNGSVSLGIKIGTLNKWSHVGMVVKIPDWDLMLLWESTTLSNLKDLSSGEFRSGVQLVQLSDRIAKYDGSVAIRRLNFERTPERLRALAKFRKEIQGRPYEKKPMELIKAAYDGPFGANQEDLSSLFCSEQITEAYQRMTLLGENISSNELTPADYADDSFESSCKQNASFKDKEPIEVEL